MKITFSRMEQKEVPQKVVSKIHLPWKNLRISRRLAHGVEGM